MKITEYPSITVNFLLVKIFSVDLTELNKQIISKFKISLQVFWNIKSFFFYLINKKNFKKAIKKGITNKMIWQKIILLNRLLLLAF